ncbi:hypothetical protein COU12_01800 [Candidatus Jorgensenbacteria bacterium CG10_big_fil_rev_8_21_14_0_10_54_38]|uniref:DOD-type homing endonuclease domain-containing protein n=2 Tax=Candidatus Joergenseniibacteriota TaxID=1752739 RepID=A0A2M6WFX4_9BACT|nr:MAG: hypothetical protein COX26_01430 [Candidatus Jorgensenbacteria bacterium CG23_combo_of_CG06-09_8_20_14_all_54_14]PIT91676.1 MAG: hypothetical protein COU12_01800 [Candidatus Jorgensenbacteria bacterium CG10_big_fil_rev_8_21_14_0_10_54_38]
MVKVSTATLSADTLQDLYVQKKLSTWTIERLTGFSRSTAYARLKKCGIVPRDLATAHIKYPRDSYKGDDCDRAYLLGFTIGDLRVRRHGGERSKTISIGCASTKPAQIKLIKSLFSPYGRVWVGQRNREGKIFVEAFVDLSFGFLLTDERLKINWVFSKNEHFLSFLAGFTDAEGSVFISRNQAFVSWGNYNHELLSRIKSNLEKLGIQVGSVVSDHLQGYKDKDGYVRSADYHHLTCGRKKSVQMILTALQPLMRHTDKKRALSEALKNITIRNKQFGSINM